MSFTAILNSRVVVGVGSNAKAAERAVRFAADNLVQPDTRAEIVLVTVNAVTATYSAVTDARTKQIKAMVHRRLAPILEGRGINYRWHTVHLSLPLFLGGNPGQLVGEVLCSKAADMGAAAIVLGGSGKDHLARTLLLGHSVSWTVKQQARMPVVLVGARDVPPEIPDIAHRRLESELPSLAKLDAVASAA